MRPSAAIAIQTGALRGKNLPNIHDRHIIQTRSDTKDKGSTTEREREREKGREGAKE